MGSTQFFGLAFFDLGETLTDPLSVSKEISRFTLIDKQLYGMASVFGDGVIDGWTVVQSSDLEITISAGIGAYNKIAIETSFPESIENLTPSSTFYIYAVPSVNAELDRSVTFLASLFDDENGLLLAKVVTSSTAIQSIDNDIRKKIGFKEIISEEIRNHRHDGTISPKIDLSQEVGGQLSNARLSDLDASKITRGKINKNTIPVLSHSQLTNTGNLSHPQIDTLLDGIKKDNSGLLGEVASINMMKMMLYNKYLFPEVDKYFVNEFAIIPGISPDSYIDWDKSTAHINIDNNCISGVKELPLDLQSPLGQTQETNSFQIINSIWDQDSQFINESILKTNLTINDGVRLSINSSFDQVLDDFEGIVNANVTTYSSSSSVNYQTKVVYNANSIQGLTAALFDISGEKKAYFYKDFSTSQDWRNFNNLNIFVRNVTNKHAAVFLEIYNSDNLILGTFQVLSQDEITENQNGVIGFAKKIIDISTINRDDIKKIAFITDEIENNNESFLVDTIYLSSNEFYLPQGNLRLRKNTSAPVIFNSISYDADVPVGTDIRIRSRVANSLAELSNAPFSFNLQSGQLISQSGTFIEIDVIFISNVAKTLTPKLNSISLQILAPSEVSGVEIGDFESWNNALETFNIKINDEINSNIEINYKNVGNFYFINSNIGSELDPNNYPFSSTVSQNLPISPHQAYNIFKPRNNINDPDKKRRVDIRGLFNPKSIYRIKNGNYVIADTGNDRIIEVDPSGLFVRGYASHNYDYEEDSLYALTSNYNPRLGVLFITLSQNTDIRNFDLTTIRLKVGSVNIRLSNQDDKLRYLNGEIVTERSPGATSANPPDNLEGDLDRVLTILISREKQEILKNVQSGVQCSISTNIRDFIECFIGDYMYFGSFGISRPVFANESNNERYIVANASVLSDSTRALKTFPVIEFNKNIGDTIAGSSTPLGLTFSYDSVQFSDIMLGSLQVIETKNEDGELLRKLLISGIVQNVSKSSSSSSSGDLFSIDLPEDETLKMANFKGIVRLIDMTSLLPNFEYKLNDGSYPSDAYYLNEDTVIVSESSVVRGTGRITYLYINGYADGEQPPITKLIEGGMFTKIWDVRNLNNGHLFVST